VILFLPLYRYRPGPSRAEAISMEEAVAAYKKRLPQVVANLRRNHEILEAMKRRSNG
jgi:hypothetical protein